MLTATIKGKSAGKTLLNHSINPSREALKTSWGYFNKKIINKILHTYNNFGIVLDTENGYLSPDFGIDIRIVSRPNIFRGWGVPWHIDNGRTPALKIPVGEGAEGLLIDLKALLTDLKALLIDLKAPLMNPGAAEAEVHT